MFIKKQQSLTNFFKALIMNNQFFDEYRENIPQRKMHFLIPHLSLFYKWVSWTFGSQILTKNLSFFLFLFLFLNTTVSALGLLQYLSLETDVTINDIKGMSCFKINYLLTFSFDYIISKDFKPHLLHCFMLSTFLQSWLNVTQHYQYCITVAFQMSLFFLHSFIKKCL